MSHPYISRPIDALTRPLRREPVRRDEVRIYCRLGVLRITMPVGTYLLEERGEYRSQNFVGDPALWRPLMDELATQYAAHDESCRRFGLPVRSPTALPKPEIFWGVEYACGQCGAQFVAHKFAGNRVPICSDRCARERRVAQQRQWHEAAPQYRQRAEARAGRTCEQCGAAIEAARSTKRFCSDRCRIRAHHQRRKEAANGEPGLRSVSPKTNSPQ